MSSAARPSGCAEWLMDCAPVHAQHCTCAPATAGTAAPDVTAASATAASTVSASAATAAAAAAVSWPGWAGAWGGDAAGATTPAETDSC